MIENNRIIIVDDDEADLQKLSSVFHTHGVGCKSFHYDGFNFPAEPLIGVRFAFFDINLIQANQDADINASLKDAISQFISIENGPFILIFWSKNTDKITQFRDFINRSDDDFKKKLKPILLETIDKSEFIEKGDSLKEKLDSILSKDFAKCLVGFEEEVLTAANQTLDILLSTIPYGNNWGETTDFDKNCQDVFSKIAVASFGFNRAKSDPDAAIKESITPIFESLLLQKSTTYWKDYLQPLKNAKRHSEISFPPMFSPAKLNTIFHIDTYKIEERLKTERGAVCGIPEEQLDNVFNNVFKISHSDWFARTFPGLKKNDRTSSIIIALEISAACDFSQDKKRTNKFMLGALIEEDSLENLDRTTVGDFLLIPSFSFNIEDKHYIIGLNLNYTFIEQENSLFLSNPKFILRKEIMDMIGNRYANHVSRIGITCF